jgi:hypothetical protein
VAASPLLCCADSELAGQVFTYWEAEVERITKLNETGERVVRGLDGSCFDLRRLLVLGEESIDKDHLPFHKEVRAALFASCLIARNDDRLGLSNRLLFD